MGRFQRIFVDSLGFFRILWDSLGFFGILEEARGFFEDSKRFLEISWVDLKDSSEFIEIL